MRPICKINKFFRNKLYRNLWWVMTIVSVVIIYVLRFTEWRPFVCHNPEDANYTMETLSYSIISASLFYVIIDYLPYISQKKAADKYINTCFGDIYESLRQLISFMYIFRLDINTIDREMFRKDFCNEDLLTPNFRGNLTKEDYINVEKEKIKSICTNLLSLYLRYLKPQEVEFIDKAINSYFIRVHLVPMIQNLDDEIRHFYDDNQEMIADSIYDLYEDIKKIY